MRTLLIDNYDSFTYNLYQLISQVNGVEPVVVRNDEVGSIEELGLDGFDNIVISPGPGRPDVARDFGISAELIARSELPLLGVCLGHQGIVIAAGGEVVAAPRARHGYPDRITHDGRELFAGVPQDFSAVRYHSLCAARPLPESLEVTATAPDGVIMGVRHRTRPRWGVQFHPESIASAHGELLLRNFAALTAEYLERQGVSRATGRTAVTRTPIPVAPSPAVAEPVRYRVEQAVIERAVDAEAVFDALYSASPHAFWLDSEHVEPGLDRFSFLGDASGPLAEVVRYRVGSGHVEIESATGRRTVPGGVLDYLSAELRRREIDFPDVPFDFAGGYVGYLGYEMKADCGARAGHRAPTPDAQWIFADRLIVVDHEAGRTHLLALSEPESPAAARDWRTCARAIVETLPTWENPPLLALHVEEAAVESVLTRGRARYLADVAACREQLLAGESYEICITDGAHPPVEADGLAVYRALRRSNPAPYAAFLRFAELEVACSSPERFLKVDRSRTVESKPIKGTAPRGRTPAEDAELAAALARSPKTRAENLMIVDLLRNDLGRVCEIGSVHVPHLMSVETYTTLHQLVSTVRGTLRPDLTVIDCLRACFPGGSMTGAPKLRTLEIIDTLETEARGVYSGTIGFLGLGGTADLNIVIRTAVRHEGHWRVGAGGAIVLDSDPSDEYREMLWKAAAALRALPGLGTPLRTPLPSRG
ncbi:aminodeoxychorismate synthase [Nocardia seriolae]|nr:aminodeoxychorismate synthase [Nocardia seriolae]MTJ65155.1 aminodeoxychorismate synthase [Nocardia seriolae]MTJ71253.1 aminodeoxychorismate synthase [Nocardia seriolae]MTJ86921.1 aminodeoxychorismate synthase [Nocardia seriolae]MTK30916.1 aminodeoxychorismate synthase [Nocardia seriolae]MTK43109.1 aminodeoxychorismate synthase [Nocardia seriolae]